MINGPVAGFILGLFKLKVSDIKYVISICSKLLQSVLSVKPISLTLPCLKWTLLIKQNLTSFHTFYLPTKHLILAYELQRHFLKK